MAYQKICQYANEHGISFASIAKKAGMEYQTFISTMNGNRSLTADEYVAICYCNIILKIQQINNAKC